jgi:hypothetical protein
MKRTRPIALTALCAILLSGPMATSASAADPVTDHETIAAVERAAPPAAVIDPAPAGPGQLKATATDGGTVTIPVDPAGTLALTGPDGRPVVRLGLPDTPQQGDAAVAADGTVTYDDPTGKTALAVQALPDGVRAQTVIAGPGAPIEYAYPLTLPPGSSLQPSGDGGFLVLDASGLPSAEITAPWAKDAEGNQVSTRYQQRGRTLIQIVDHRQPGTTYPVVADPNVITCGIVTCSLYIGKAQTRSIANYVGRYANATQGAIAAAFLAACSPLGPYAAVCAAAGVIYGGFAVDQFVYARSQNKCIRLRYLVAPPGGLVGIYVDGSGYCGA